MDTEGEEAEGRGVCAATTNSPRTKDRCGAETSHRASPEGERNGKGREGLVQKASQKDPRESQSGLGQWLLAFHWAGKESGVRVNSKNRMSRSGAEPLQGQISGARECQDFSRYQNMGT